MSLLRKRQLNSAAEASSKALPSRPVAVEVAALVIAGSAVAVAAQAAHLGKWWIAFPLAIVTLGILSLVVPKILKAIAAAIRAVRRHRALKRSWAGFRREVEELEWIFKHSDARSLATALGVIHSSLMAAEHQARRDRTHEDIVLANAIGFTQAGVIGSIQRTWPGEAAARQIIAAFEALIDIPERGRFIARLEAHSAAGTTRLVGEWPRLYVEQIATYARFARDQNRLIGERVYREYFG